MIAVLSLSWQWLAVAIVVGGIAYVGGHESGYAKGRRDQRADSERFHRNRERAS